MRVIVCLAILFTFYQVAAQPKEVRILAFRQPDCEPYGDPFKVHARIIQQKEYGNILFFKIGTSASCCATLKPAAVLKNEALYLSYEEEEEEEGKSCECTCYFELEFELQRVADSFIQVFFQDEPVVISREKYKTYDVAFKLFNGDTIDFQDKYGRKQGKWHLQKNLPVTNSYLEFRNDTLIRQVDLYPQGLIKNEILSGKLKIEDEGKRSWLYTFANKYVEYFESGKVKTECKGKNITDAYWDGSCKEWNEKGELIYEGPYKK